MYLFPPLLPRLRDPPSQGVRTLPLLGMITFSNFLSRSIATIYWHIFAGHLTMFLSILPTRTAYSCSLSPLPIAKILIWVSNRTFLLIWMTFLFFWYILSLSLDNPLASGFSILTGSVEITWPTTIAAGDYSLVCEYKSLFHPQRLDETF